MPAVTCYMCNSPKTGDEHAPPRCLFPEKKDLADGADLRVQLITVPSCDLHNQSKSREDEFLLYVLSMNIASSDTGIRQFQTKVARAIQRRPTLIQRLLGNAVSVIVHDRVTNRWFRTAAFEVDSARLSRCFELTGRAIYFHETGRRWDGRVDVHPEFVLSMAHAHSATTNLALEGLSKAVDGCVANVRPRGMNPRVFEYRFIEQTTDSSALLRMTFYGAGNVTVFFPKERTRSPADT